MRALFLLLGLLLAACGGGSSGAPPLQPPPLPPPPPVAPTAPNVSVDVGIKQLIFNWTDVSGATHYRLLENPDGHSGFTQLGADIPAGTESLTLPIAVHSQDFGSALYMLEACNTAGCTSSTEVNAMNGALSAIGYFKASNAEHNDFFSASLALSADGSTIAVGASGEASDSNGIDGDQTDNSSSFAGAVYVFRFNGTAWSQQSYVKASNSDRGDAFGISVALDAGGNTLAVGATRESSKATGVGGDQNDNSFGSAGAAYVFRFDGAAWSQEAYIKASNTGSNDLFGRTVALSADGDTLAVGAETEGSSATAVDGDQQDDSSFHAGAAYVYRFDGTAWSQQAYIKASNTDPQDEFGGAVALSADGDTLAVGASCEGSKATGINGNQDDNASLCSGAVYVYRFGGTNWFQQAYVKASNTEPNEINGLADVFGRSVALSDDGNTLAVGAFREDSGAVGIDGDQDDNSADRAGAAYVFRFDGTAWSQQAYVKASNTGAGDSFHSVALSGDGNTLAVGATGEDSNSTGVAGNQNDDSSAESGAVYVFSFDGTQWSQQAYVKASNTDALDGFGQTVALSTDGTTLLVGTYQEDSNATGVDGDQNDDSEGDSGAVYLY